MINLHKIRHQKLLHRLLKLLSDRNASKHQIFPSLKNEKFIDAGLKTLEQFQNIIEKKDNQEMSYGKNVCQQLEGIEDRQKFIAQKLISYVSDVILC